MYARNAGLFYIGGLDRYAPIIDKLVLAYDRGSIASITSTIFHTCSARDITFIKSALEVAIYNSQLKAAKALDTMKDMICANSDTTRDELVSSDIVLIKYTNLFAKIDYSEMHQWKNPFSLYNSAQSVIGKFLSVSALFHIEIKHLEQEANKENTHPGLTRL